MDGDAAAGSGETSAVPGVCIGAELGAIVAAACDDGAFEICCGVGDGFRTAISGVGRTLSVHELFSRSGHPIEKLVMPRVTSNDPTRMIARYQVQSRRAKFVTLERGEHEGWASSSGKYIEKS